MTGMGKWWTWARYVVPAVAVVSISSIFVLVSDRSSSSHSKLTERNQTSREVVRSDRAVPGQAGSSPFSSAGQDRDRATATATATSGEPNVLEEHDASPLQMITPDDSQNRILYEAEELAVQQCMNELGFEYIPNAFEHTDGSQDGLVPVDLSAPNEAKARGYGIVEFLATVGNVDTLESVTTKTSADVRFAQQSENDAMVERMAEDRKHAWTQALLGNLGDSGTQGSGSLVELETPSMAVIAWDSNSCISAARRAIYGSDLRFMEDVLATEALNNEIWKAVENSEVYRNALQKWQRCMTSNELNYDYPGQAAGQLVTDYQEGRMTLRELKAREIDVASVDTQCYESSQFAEATELADRQAELEVFRSNKEAFEALRSSLASSTETASRFLR